MSSQMKWQSVQIFKGTTKIRKCLLGTNKIFQKSDYKTHTRFQLFPMHNGNYGTAPPAETFDSSPYDIKHIRDFNCSQCTMAITVRRHLQKHLKIYPRILQHTKGRQRLNMYGQAGRQAERPWQLGYKI